MADALKEPVTKTLPAKQSEDFDARHEKDLSIKRFGYVAGMQMIIPLATTAAGAALGYFTLGKPIRMLFPNVFRGIGHFSDLMASATHITVEQLIAAKKTIAEIAPEALARIRQTKPEFEVDSLANLGRLLKETSTTEMSAIKNALGITTQSEIAASKYTGAAVVGIVGGMAGGTAVGYDKWRKEESARLAAEEINHDISKMELFRPSNPELTAENHRLRQMLETKPGATIGQVEHQGRAQHHPAHQIS